MIDWNKTEKEFKINKTNYKFSSTVVVICDGCGVFGHKKIRSKKNVINGQMMWKCMSCHLDNPDTKIKKSKASKKMWEKHHDKIVKSIDYSKVSTKAKEKWKDKEYRNKVLKTIEDNKQFNSERMKKKWQNEDYRSKMMSIYSTKEWKKSRSEIASDAWQDEDYRKVVAGHNFNKRISKEEFLRRASETHGDRYDYSEVDCKTYCQDRVKIICKKHGEFWQIPKSHVNGCGCSLCAGTHLQAEIYEFVHKLVGGIVKNNDRSSINPNELDIFVPDKSLAIEVNGMYWHSFDHVEDNEERNRHLNKLNKCIDQNISLIQITEYEWKEKRPIVESIIANKIGKSDRTYARKCKIKKINIQEYRKFININHLQGYKFSHVIYGLEYNNELVSVMSFNKHPKHEWEITRFANKLGYTVVGGASKLFKRFLKEVNPQQILTYADRRYSKGNLYKQLGFKLDGVTKPNYCYVKGINPHSRQQFQKHKLKNKLNFFDSELTEAENMFNNGYRRMWDAGNYRFLWSGGRRKEIIELAISLGEPLGFLSR